MSPETKKLLDAARRHEAGPDSATKDRVRRNILGSIATTAGVAATGSASAAGAGATTSAVVASSTSFTVLKLGVAGLVVATAGVVTVQRLSTSRDGDTTSIATVSTALAPSVASTSPATPTEPARDVVDATPSSNAVDLSAPVDAAAPVVVNAPASSGRTMAPTGAKSASATEAAIVTPASLDAERALIANARGKLASGDSAGALMTLGEHAAAHPRGALSNERRALTAIAYCNQGNVAQGLQTFSLPADAKDSPLSARVRAACVK